MKKVVSILISISLILMSVPAFAISGSGTEANPYLISSASDILRIHNDLDGYYKLTADINMQGIEYEPVGNEYEGAFTGTIDGNGHTISNLNINLPENKYVGLVGFLEGTVKNLNLNNVNACGYNYIGGIAGYAEEGSKIYNCSVTGTISDIYKILRPYVGGITGHNNGTITDCSNRGFVHDNSGLDIVGGIAGSNSGIITDCVNSGEITGSNLVGGIAGYNSGTITDCTNSGNVSGGDHNGGIAGSNNGTITDCVNSGEITGSYNVGGIAGSNSGIITDCVNSGEISNSKHSAGGITGYNSGTITDCSNSGDISDGWPAGAIVASNNNGKVSNCISVSLVKGNETHYVSNKIITLSAATLHCGTRCTMPIELYEYDRDRLTWVSSNNSVATVDQNGVVTGVMVGTATITATTTKGISTSATVTVTAPVSTGITLNNESVSLQKGYTYRLIATLTPSDSQDAITWSTSNSNYVSVSSDGIITANRVGAATITATSTSGKKAYCVVNVTEPTISVSSVTLNKTELVLTQADMAQLTAEVLPSNATNKDIVWTSSDEAVATVSNTGVVTATGVGTAIIKATANNGMYHECGVKVISASGSSVILRGAKASPNGTAQVKASIVRNPGISGYKFTVDYDDTLLTPVSVEANSEFGGSFASNLNDSSRTELNVLWYSDSNVDTNSDLFTINFEVKDSAVYGDTSAISLNYGAKDICNTSGDSIALYIQDSTVNIAEPLPGDIYEDDEVTVFDLTLLARYITGLETFTDRQLEAADVNDDNDVDIKDVVTLAQYIVGWSNVQLMSFRGIRGLMGVNIGTASVNESFEAEIPVCISNNPGVAGFRYVIEHSNDLEILSITPTMDGIKDKFQTNLGQQGDNDLIVSWYNTDNMTENGELFKIKVRLTNPDADISQISIKPAENNMCNENKQDVIAEYEDGYVMNSNYIIANQTVTDTTFTCELYFDNTFEEQTAKAILGFYDEQHKLVQFELKDITVKPGKVDLRFDIEDKPYSTYKIMLWEGLNSMRPLVDVR